MLLLRVKVTSFMSFARQKPSSCGIFSWPTYLGSSVSISACQGAAYSCAASLSRRNVCKVQNRCGRDQWKQARPPGATLVPTSCGATCLTPTCLTPLPDGVAQWQIQDATWSHGIRPRSIYIMRNSVPWLSLALSAEIFIFLIFRLSC